MEGKRKDGRTEKLDLSLSAFLSFSLEWRWVERVGWFLGLLKRKRARGAYGLDFRDQGTAKETKAERPVQSKTRRGKTLTADEQFDILTKEKGILLRKTATELDPDLDKRPPLTSFKKGRIAPGKEANRQPHSLPQANDFQKKRFIVKRKSKNPRTSHKKRRS